MRPKLIINDTPLGVNRAAGTTQQTAAALRGYLQDKLQELMLGHTDHDIIINGDLFDAYIVAMADVLRFYITACMWLDTGEGDMTLGAGNHDLSKDDSRLSSFEFIARILVAQYPDRVRVVMQPTDLGDRVCMIPHLANQDLFNLALVEAENLKNGTILLHANYDNNFTAESDHSLNVSREQAKRLIDNGNRLIFGHEHQARVAFGGNLIVTGNQWPSSVADCLNNPGDEKHALIITEAGKISGVTTWDGDKHFMEQAWDDLDIGRDEDYSFIRVVGKATAEQAGDVITSIAKFRNKSRAFVVSNAVKIEGAAEMSDLPSSIETAKTFDVLAYLYENLDADEAEVVRGLLAQVEPMKEAA